ncbi:MAG: hypothetical protein KBT45_04865 [Bacteroidales bacterium]|nr:hypothetical protein [Candidatus Colimorpha pelethequi]
MSSMNRITYLLKAKTQYNIHSPFVFEMYNNVLAAKLNKKAKAQIPPTPYPKSSSLVYKLAHYYHLQSKTLSPTQTLLLHDSMRMMVVAKPHHNKSSEKEWATLQQQWPVSIDLFDSGLLIDNPQLHPQQFLLRVKLSGIGM